MVGRNRNHGPILCWEARKTMTSRLNRRDFARYGFGVAALGAMAIRPASISALAPKIESTQRGDMPTTGGMRPGPTGANPVALASPGFKPVAIKIDAAAVDAVVETLEIVDGVMQNPTGPWVVSWYKETGRLGLEKQNVVVAAHVDYWNVGPAVFYNVSNLKEGDIVDLTGEDNNIYRYQVEWLELYDADNAPIADIVGDTGETSLTMITCGGEFDYADGEYLSRTVVRASFVEKNPS
jgi:LPXTG-site transpeptidase (sortase) family protein